MDELDLAEPPRSVELGDFPRRTLTAGRRIVRIHHADLGPFWFGSSTPDRRGGGRFDLPNPNGTSYWSLSSEAAFLETIARRPVAIVPLELVDRFQLTEVALPRDLTCANAPVQRARAFGLSAEFHTTTRYRLTRRWAIALHRAGARALLAIPRHDVSARLRTLALFGRAGEHRPYGWAWRPRTGPIPSALVDAMASWGIRCVPVPFEVETSAPR